MEPPARLLALVAVAITAVVGAAACDTDDGRQLQPTIVPTPAPTVPTTVEGQVQGQVDGQVVPVTEATAIPEAFRLVAPWSDEATIDERYTCDGDDISPALSWVGVPDGTIELALVVTDPDADGFVHWIAAGIDPANISLVEDIAPQSLKEATNGFGDLGWGGPCPPEGGGEHVYEFTLYALGQPSSFAASTPAGQIIASFAGAALKSTTLTGRYSR